MTPASALRLLLIWLASFSRSPDVHADFCRSLPARSMRWNEACEAGRGEGERERRRGGVGAAAASRSRARGPTFSRQAAARMRTVRERMAAPPCVRSAVSIVSVKTLWLRDDSWFMAVALTRRFLAPSASSARACATDDTTVSVRPSTYTPRDALSRSASDAPAPAAPSAATPAGAHRSNMRSL
jgi:hypothetical protein